MLLFEIMSIDCRYLNGPLYTVNALYLNQTIITIYTLSFLDSEWSEECIFICLILL